MAFSKQKQKKEKKNTFEPFLSSLAPVSCRFASSRSGHILEIDYRNVVIRNVRRLLPTQQSHSKRREKQTFSTGERSNHSQEVFEVLMIKQSKAEGAGLVRNL